MCESNSCTQKQNCEAVQKTSGWALTDCGGPHKHQQLNRTMRCGRPHEHTQSDTLAHPRRILHLRRPRECWPHLLSPGSRVDKRLLKGKNTKNQPYKPWGSFLGGQQNIRMGPGASLGGREIIRTFPWNNFGRPWGRFGRSRNHPYFSLEQFWAALGQVWAVEKSSVWALGRPTNHLNANLPLVS